MTSVRKRLFTPSPAMVYLLGLHTMKRVERVLDMTTSTCSCSWFGYPPTVLTIITANEKDAFEQSAVIKAAAEKAAL